MFTTIRTHGFIATAGAVKVVSGGSRGLVADASLAYPVHATSRITLTPIIGTTWADRTYNDHYFGITPTEALASGRSQFSARAGFKDVTGMLTIAYRLTDHLTLSATGGATALVGNVRNSPLVDQKTQPTGILALSYRFR